MIPQSFKDIHAVPDTGSIPQVPFSLDGGGREMLIDFLREKQITTMVEVGSFLGGSAIQWLSACPRLHVIGIDPWEGDWAKHLQRYKDNPVFESCWTQISDRDIAIATLAEHGPYQTTMANMQAYNDRFFPFIGKSPAALMQLHTAGVVPDLIYFDSNKVLDDLEVSLELFPNAVLSGDDWRWGAKEGFPVQTAVKAFCKRHGFKVEDQRATWIVHKTL